MRTILFFSFTLLQLQFYITCQAQNEKETFTQLMKEDSADISTIASYQEKIRLAVFEACTQPKGIANMNDIQKKSAEEFRLLLSTFSKDDQKKIWNLARYNGLIGKLVRSGRMSKEALEEVLKDEPKEIHEDAMHFTLQHFDLLKAVNNINELFNQSFERMINEYPSSTQNAFRELLNTPELVSLLNNNMHLAVHLGDIYQKNPQYLKQQFDTLSLELAEQKAKDLEEWKQKMKDNPEAENELKQSAKEYAQEYGYSNNDYYETDPRIIYQYVYVPYPYWCGYPWWYEYEWWYPYPYWHHWGFCYWHGDIFWHTPPSWFFIRWHFGHHPHFYHYPNITNVYINYYHGHHRAEPRNPVVVHKWVEENRSILPKDFLMNTPESPAVIKEFGKFSNDYYEDKRRNNELPKSEDYLEQNARRYPNLKPSPIIPAEKKSNDYYELKPREQKPVLIQPEIKPSERFPDRQYEKPRQDILRHPEPVQPKQPQIRVPEKQIQPEIKQQPVKPRPDIQPRQEVKPIPKQEFKAPQQKMQTVPGRKKP